MAERCKDLIGRIVRATRELRTRGGDQHPSGSLWRVASTWRGRYDLELLGPKAYAVRNPNGTKVYVLKVRRDDFEILAEAGPREGDHEIAEECVKQAELIEKVPHD